MAAVERELGLVDPAGAEVGGDQRDGLGAPGGEHQPVGRQVEPGGQGRLGGVDVGIAAQGVEVGRGQRGDVGRGGVEAGRQVEDLVGPQPERRGDARPVPAVLPGRRHLLPVSRAHDRPRSGARRRGP